MGWNPDGKRNIRFGVQHLVQPQDVHHPPKVLESYKLSWSCTVIETVCATKKSPCQDLSKLSKHAHDNNIYSIKSVLYSIWVSMEELSRYVCYLLMTDDECSYTRCWMLSTFVIWTLVFKANMDFQSSENFHISMVFHKFWKRMEQQNGKAITGGPSSHIFRLASMFPTRHSGFPLSQRRQPQLSAQYFSHGHVTHPSTRIQTWQSIVVHPDQGVFLRENHGILMVGCNQQG